MTALLTAAAVIMTISLFASAAATFGQATPSDQQKRGRWGIATRTRSRRARPLNPHERRWQTALLGGKDNDSRWRDVVAELEALQRLSSTPVTPSISPAPDSYDANWLNQVIAELEAAMITKTVAAKTVAAKDNSNHTEEPATR